MKIKLSEYQNVIADSYALLILSILPLHMNDKLNRIGDAKYIFFRNISLLFFVAWIAGMAVYLWKEYRHSSNDCKKEAGCTFSRTDQWALLFALISVISYLFSNYKTTALWGYADWHMGLITQLLLVWGYYLVSRWYSGRQFVWVCAALSAVAVFAVGISNRMGDDPLGVFSSMSWWDWNRRNLLSTIGNINWYCCYATVLLPLVFYSYWNAKGLRRIPAALGVFIGIGSMLLQGSDSGYIALGVMLIVLLLGSLKDSNKLLRCWEIFMMIPLFCLIMTIFQVDLILPFQSTIMEMLHSSFWGWLLIGLFLLYGIIWYFHKHKEIDFLKDGKLLRITMIGLGIIFAITLFIFILCQVSDSVWQFFGRKSILHFDQEWGSMRGALWIKAWNGFIESSLPVKLYGAGPDCFAPYLYGNFDMNIQISGQWQDAVYANAHNEWLNMLITEGILGLVAYAGFFISAFNRFRKHYHECPLMLVGMMTIAAYVSNNFFNFQQVVSTPHLFLIIAMCEHACRTNYNSSVQPVS